MTPPRWFTRTNEKVVTSIYSQFSPSAQELSLLLSDSEVALSLKFTAALAAFSQLTFPLCIGDFRALIPDSLWQEHFGLSCVGFLGGFVPIFWGEHEWFYTLHLGPRKSPCKLFAVYLVASSKFLPDTDPDCGDRDLPLATPVSRFTLSHPFIKYELHDKSGVYFFKGA